MMIVHTISRYDLTNGIIGYSFSGLPAIEKFYLAMEKSDPFLIPLVICWGEDWLYLSCCSQAKEVAKSRFGELVNGLNSQYLFCQWCCSFPAFPAGCLWFVFPDLMLFLSSCHHPLSAFLPAAVVLLVSHSGCLQGWNPSPARSGLSVVRSDPLNGLKRKNIKGHLVWA